MATTGSRVTIHMAASLVELIVNGEPLDHADPDVSSDAVPRNG